MNPDIFIGVNDKGLKVYVSQALIDEHGIDEVKDRLGVSVKRYPVRTSLSDHPYNTVMVKGDSHEDAVNRWLNRVEK